MAKNTTRLGGSKATFASMMENGFGIVTVMNAKIYETSTLTETDGFFDKTAPEILTALKAITTEEAGYVCELDTLKIANVPQEGPTKIVTGGRYSNPLIKFGKSARLEMQDALGNAKAIDALCGGVREWDADTTDEPNTVALHFGEDFNSTKTIVGDSFFIDRKTGQQVKVKILFYQFLPDAIFNLTQDAEGDATVFDMNGDLLTTEIKVGDNEGTSISHGIFYSIIEEPTISNN